VFQQLLDPSSLLATNQHGINIVLLRLEDWSGRESDSEESRAVKTHDAFERIERGVKDLARALTVAVARGATPHLVCICPPSLVEPADPERTASLKRLEDLLVSQLAEIRGVHVVTTAALATTYPVVEYYDLHGDRLAHMPYTPIFYTALGTMIARKVYALESPRYKVIVLDCDQTLWRGICGEDGAFGVEIDPARMALQEFMLRQHDAGMLLCLASKNNEEDVAEVFELRSEMLLKREHVVASRLNWRPKSDNIKSLAQELNLGLDSFIFVDDDPVECEEVQTHCPEVLTLQLPQDSDKIASFLDNVWAFDYLTVTEEGRERTALYKQNLQREQFRAESLTFKSFLAGLGLKVRINPLAPRQLARAAELTQRTNQFNLTTIRRSEAELQKFCQGNTQCLGVDVKDRFGDYGLCGVIIFTLEPEAIAVDTFLLSCRALGRGVEHRILARLGEMAIERGFRYLKVPFVSSGKNQPAREFLDGIGEEFKESLSSNLLFRFSAEFAAGVKYDPDHVEQAGEVPGTQTVSVPTSEGAITNTRMKTALLRWIGMDLYNAEQIHKVVSDQTRTQPEVETAFVAPRNSTEAKIAEIFSELLGIERVGVNDNFIQLGGHSLLAMQILSGLRDTFHIEIPLGVFFTGEITVAELAKKVIRHQILQAAPQDVGMILSMVQQLSDDEAKALLGVKTTLVEN
jgi:FkbH-like protein